MTAEAKQALKELRELLKARPYKGGSTVKECIDWAMENKGLSRDDAILDCLKIQKGFRYM